MSELCSYNNLYNEPSQQSVFGFPPPNWAWWAWHLILQPLWESHNLKPPHPPQPNESSFKEQFGKCHTSLSHVANKKLFCGLRCAHPFQSQFSTTMGFSLHKDYSRQALKMTITISFPLTHLQRDYDQSNSALETETTNLFWKIYQMDFKGGDLLLINQIESVWHT